MRDTVRSDQNATAVRRKNVWSRISEGTSGSKVLTRLAVRESSESLRAIYRQRPGALRRTGEPAMISPS